MSTEVIMKLCQSDIFLWWLLLHIIIIQDVIHLILKIVLSILHEVDA